MTAFESDGVYAGIPYRVHPDTSIEAIMLGGLIKFKNMDQFLAAAAATPGAIGTSHSLVSYDELGNHDHRNTNVPASARPLDYYSILLESIHKAEKSSAQLRALVYERARFNIKRDLLFGYSSMGLAEIVQQVNAFEHAVARIEANSDHGQANIAHRNDEAPEPARSASGTAVARIDTSPEDSETSLAYRNEAPPKPARSASRNAVEILSPRPATPVFEDLGPVQRVENLKFGRAPETARPFAVTAIQVIGSSLLGMLCIAVIVMTVVLWHSANVPPQIDAAHNMPQIVAADVKRSSGEVDTKPADAPAKLPYPVPTSFGIYALSDNKLVKLEPLPAKVPDPRVALSAEITKSSTTTISANKPSFILFRRNLLNDAPDQLTLRVVARMAQETKFVGGKATTTKIENSWRIRNTSLELKVSPIPGQGEMIIAREDDKLVLTPGRYVLVVNGLGYDFTIAGSAPSPAHCLEQFDTENGPVFTECKMP